MDMKRFFLYFIVIAALALAGCGGNGGQTAMPDPDPDPDPTPPVTCTAPQVPNADGTACVDPPPPPVDHDAVIAGIVNPSTAGDPSTARGTDASNRPGNAAASAEAFNVTAGGIDTKPTTTIGTGTNAPDDLNLDTLDKDDTAGTPAKSLAGQFKNQDMNTTLGQFAGNGHEKTVKKVTDTLNVYTNVEGPKGVLYNTYYSDGDAGTRDGVSSGTGGVLSLDKNANTGMSSLFSGSKIPTGNGTYVVIPGVDSPDVAGKENEFLGMFNGIPGTYACAGSATNNCRIDRNAMGKLVIGGEGTLQFTPTAAGSARADLMVQGVSYDADYLSFGYWVRVTEKDDGSKTYGVGTFYDGSQPYTDQTAIANLEGEATYSGKAAGMYGRKTLDQYGNVVAGSATSGHFTADASLMVRFGGDDIAVSKQNQIEGTVSNFMDGGQMISPGWTAMLKKVDLDDASLGTAGFSGDTTGNGNWRGQFFGNNPTTTDAAKQYPTGVVGDFTAHFPNGHVIGSFGATR